MKGSAGNMLLMRIFIKESDRHGGEPLYLALLELLRDEGIKGGTALRGIAGFGAHSRLHTDRFLDLAKDLPVVVEAVDAEERIEGVLPKVDAMLESGLVTFEGVRVMTYAHPRGGQP